MKKGSIKNTRINSEVLKVMAQIIRDEVKDPRISPVTSVTDVEVTPDLQYCKVYISALGGEDSLEKTIAGLKSAEGFIRRELARRVNLRHTPQVQFVPDRSLEYGAKMDRLIHEISKNTSEGEVED